MFYTPAFTTLNENAHIQVGERKKRTLRLPETHDTNNTICSQRYVTQQGIKKKKNGWHTLRKRSSRNTLCRTHMHAHAHSSLAAHFLMHNITCLSILNESIYKCVFLHTQKSFMCDAYEREKTRTQKHKRKNWTWAKLPPPPPHTHTQKESKNFHYHCYTTYSITWLLQ